MKTSIFVKFPILFQTILSQFCVIDMKVTIQDLLHDELQ